LSLGRLDQRQHDRGAFAAAVGADEQPCLSSESNAAQRTFGGVVADADASVGEEVGNASIRLSM
jgi:hypothetical protein